MKYLSTSSLFLSLVKRGIAAFTMGLLFLIVFVNETFGQWTQASGVGNTFVGCIVASGDNLLAGGGLTGRTKSRDSIFLSTNSGNSWVLVSDSVPAIITSMAPVGTDLVVGSNKPGGVYYTSDLGQTWNSNVAGFPNPFMTDYSISSLVVIGSTVFIGTGSGVYRQPALGAAWMPDTVGMGIGDGQNASVNSLFVNGANFFAGTNPGGAFISTDNGASWSSINNGLPNSSFSGIIIDDIAATGATLIAALADSNEISTDIYSSTNNGQDWNRAAPDTENWGSVYGLISSGAVTFIATDSGVYYSSDIGVNWTQSNQGLPVSNLSSPSITSIETSGAYLVIGTNANGIWTRKLSDYGISSGVPLANSSGNGDLNLSISENPASVNETKINYTLQDDGPVEVSLIDVLGRSVTLQSGRVSAGLNEVGIDPQKFEPGTYFIRVEADGIAAMQKLVISR